MILFNDFSAKITFRAKHEELTLRKSTGRMSVGNHVNADKGSSILFLLAFWLLLLLGGLLQVLPLHTAWTHEEYDYIDNNRVIE